MAAMTNSGTTGNSVDLSDVQGNILRGYRRAKVRHLVVQITDATRARAWIGATAGPDRSVAPAITDAAHWGERPPDVCFNLGITYAGMQALGVPDATSNSFPKAFAKAWPRALQRLAIGAIPGLRTGSPGTVSAMSFT
jgi:hypothetical protein